jgi:hypothetical protein
MVARLCPDDIDGIVAAAPALTGRKLLPSLFGILREFIPQVLMILPLKLYLQFSISNP